jgi:hypothetical protein
LLFENQVASFFHFWLRCCPNPDQKRIGGSPHKGLDPQFLLDGFEENLYLPPIFVYGGNRR